MQRPLLCPDERRKILGAAIDALPDQARTVVSLCVYEELTRREIGAILEVTESRICQIYTSALRRLRRHLKCHHIEVGDLTGENLMLPLAARAARLAY